MAPTQLPISEKQEDSQAEFEFPNKNYSPRPSKFHRQFKCWMLALYVTTLIGTYFGLEMISHPKSTGKQSTATTDVVPVEDLCPLGDIIRPSSFLRDNSSVEYIIKDAEYRQDSIKKLSGAVKIPTISRDDSQSPIEDPEAWNNFTRFHWFLESQFPEVYETLKVEKHNQYGLLLTWEGSNPDLKPLLLMAHQDVVPIDPATLKDWKFPPFEGNWDDEFIYGRGTSDCKSLVVGYYQAFTRLITEGFKPHRTVVISLGFDEEIGGLWGASELAQVLIKRYGNDSFFAILDEGGSSIDVVNGVPVALPSIGEKGSVNIDISLTTPGGHSSIPPDHTNIGIVSELIREIEATPFDSLLSAKNPTLNYLQCVAKHTDSIDDRLKKDIFNAGGSDEEATSRVIDYLSGIRALKYTVKTTQAIDVIHGGVKSNALPEFTKVTINHRISIESSIYETVAKILGNVKYVAANFKIGVLLNDEEIVPATENGHFQISYVHGLSPAKVSPTDNDSYNLFRGTIKHIIKDYIYPDLAEPVVAGNLNSGNTDTNRYWALSDNIYRFKFSSLNGLISGATHSINEKVKIDDLLSLIGFVYEYVKNVDEFEGN